MKQMNGLDRMFMNIESERVPMDFIGIFTLDPTNAPGHHDFDCVRGELIRRLPSIPVFTRRPICAPFGAGHEHWVVDQDFSVDRHLKHVGVPAPYDLQALCDLAISLFDEPLDRRRPLWQMYYVDGLKDGRAALLLRMHHAAMDAVGGIEVVTRLFDSEPQPTDPDPGVSSIDKERVPSGAEMLIRSVPDQITAPARITYRGLPVVAALTRRLLSQLSGKPSARSTEQRDAEDPAKNVPQRTVLNRVPDTAKRSLAVTSIPMDEIIEAKNRFKVTVNDVVLSIVGGAVAHYLRDRDELPDGSLRVAAPVNVRNDSAESGSGNHFTFMLVQIPSDSQGPVERLEAISRSTKNTKPARSGPVEHDRAPKAPSGLGGADMMRLIDTLPSSAWLTIGQLLKSPLLVAALPPVANYVVSNIPGPKQAMYFAGAEITHLYGRAITAAGIGLFVHCFSYAGNLDFGFTALADLVPDPERIAEGVQREFCALHACI